MNTPKHSPITPQIKRLIAERVRAGEKQVALAKEYGISKGYLSKIVKSIEVGRDEDATDFRRMPLETLRNRYKETHRQIHELYDDKYVADKSIERARAEILWISEQMQSSKLDHMRKAYESTLLGMRQQITGFEDQTRVDLSLQQCFATMTELIAEFRRRGVTVPPKWTEK